MIRIALLGEIGSGKSYMAKLLGFPVFNADEEIKKIARKQNKSYTAMKENLLNQGKKLLIGI